MEGKWTEVKIVTCSGAVEQVCGILYGIGVKGVAIEDPNDIYSGGKNPLSWDYTDTSIFEYGGEAAVVKGYFDEGSNVHDIKNYVIKKLDDLKNDNTDIGKGLVFINTVKEEDWANNWKKYYKTTKIGNKIVVKPLWEKYEKKDGEIVLELDPGMAFGNGTHETTRMCINALEKYVKEGSTLFDIGTGSGILSIAASKLGAKSVTAVDFDHAAVESAKKNIKYNNIQNIKVLYGNLTDVVKGKADIIVANIIAEVIVTLSKSVGNFIKDGGYFITSGIIEERQKDVEDSLKSKGFKICEEKKEGEWICIISRYEGK